MNAVFFGECMVELRPDGAATWRQGFAGDTYNTAVYFRRLDGEGHGDGATVGYAAGYGDDPFAAPMLDAWRAEGLDVSLAWRIAGRSTGLYTIAVGAGGERSFAYWRDTSAARAYFDGDDPTPLEAAAGTIDLLYFSGISLAILDAPARARLLGVADAVRARGGRVAFDNNYRPRLWRSAADAAAAYDAALARSDVALLTLDDQCAVWGLDASRATERACALPCAEVVIKRGADATRVRHDGRLEEAAVTPVQPLDTTGAGDSFAAAYLWARSRGRDPLAAARAGNALAGLVVQAPGALLPRERVLRV